MHGLDIAHTHISDDRLYVHSIPFPVIPFGIGSQNSNLIFVLRIGKPVAGFRKRVKMLFPA
jgi:hypothetical protein